MTVPNQDQFQPTQPQYDLPAQYEPPTSTLSQPSPTAITVQEKGHSSKVLIASCLATALTVTVALSIWFLDIKVRQLQTVETNTRSDTLIPSESDDDDTVREPRDRDAILADAFVACSYGETGTTLSFEQEKKILILEQHMTKNSEMKTHGCILKEMNAPDVFMKNMTDMNVDAGIRSGSWDDISVSWRFTDDGNGGKDLKAVYVQAD